MLGPFLPLVPAARPPRHRARRGRQRRARRVEYLGRLAERDTRLLTLATLHGVLAGHTEEEVNLVNAPSLAEERGIEVAETQGARRARLHRPRARSRVGGEAPRGRHDARPAPPPAPARGLGPALQPPARRRPLRALPLPRPPRHGRARRHRLRRARDQHLPGRGRPRAPGDDGHRDNVAVMVVTTDAPVPQAVVDEIVALATASSPAAPSRSSGRAGSPRRPGRPVSA